MKKGWNCAPNSIELVSSEEQYNYHKINQTKGALNESKLLFTRPYLRPVKQQQKMEDKRRLQSGV